MKKKPITILSILFILIFFVFVNGVAADPSILISSYEWDPEVFMPGDQGTLTLTISNAEATHTVASTTTTGSTTTVRTDTSGVFFNKIWIVAAGDGTNDVKADQSFSDLIYLAPASSFEITIPVKAENNIAEGLYFPKVNIDLISYDDVQYPIPVQISNATVDLLAAEVPSLISISGSTQVTLSLVNTHEGAVNSLKVTPRTVDDLTVTPSYQLVDTLTSKSSEEITFSVQPQSLGAYQLTFDLLYHNGINQHTASLTTSFEVV